MSGDGRPSPVAGRQGGGKNVSSVQSQLLGSAVLALEIATVSLWSESASANVVFDFNGTCNSSGCPLTTSTATGVLTLTNAYVFGTDMTSADFVSFSYSSSDLSFDLTSGESPGLGGGLNSDGSFNATGELTVESSAGFPVFTSRPGEFIATDQGPGGHEDVGSSFTFTNATPSAVPEPSTWLMMGIGFGFVGLLGYRKTRSALA
jgi:hypothetical protein